MAVLNLFLTPYLPVVLLVLYYAVPYFTSNRGLKHTPGPFFASISNLWLLLQARQGKRYLSVDEAHKKYGKLVRIQPDHVSVADDSAINAIYGHGNGFLKRFVYSPKPRIPERYAMYDDRIVNQIPSRGDQVTSGGSDRKRDDMICRMPFNKTKR